ncbi:ABC transporter ATP-binding protein [Hufsiella ginkgonis]|uniref:ATP-binding cassette domain-containing protein n=1 Tax=Hufsiella ginkgonis TaxID=2695274 RepID=A0A7K1Y2U2_9SPHI|nr:ATP-binding cassette domain-containing protein [Hufsiella ginkgonis]MXV17542.1 ATP-binding cassette domain-containing protein [Hufsiella ginkgonis]
MLQSVIQTHELSYRFADQQVLDKVSLQVNKGSIYGFLGPNGAGKTTTIKVLLNLLRSDDQNVFLFEKEISANRSLVLAQIGSLVEQPAIYGHLSGRENLKARAILLKVKDDRISAILDLVALSAHADKKAKNYSLGMKQRLGIGLALLHDPELLILDEPTNGLDPNGIIEIRKLLMRLTSEEGKTVFVSSHLLGEIERMATHVGIINKGKLVFQGTIGELQQLSNEQVIIETNDLVEAANTLLAGGYPADITEEYVTVPFTDAEQMGAMNTLLVNSGSTVYSIRKTKKDLEQLFLSLTQPL